MKTLLLMRHAKSSWKDPDLTDHERPLKKRGSKNAARMGKLLREKELIPQRILCSTAKRASDTAEEVSKASHYKGQIDFIGGLYMAEPLAILEICRNIPSDVERVLIIGHNPGLESLVQILNGRKVESLTTASIAYFALPIDKWSDLNEASRGELVELWQPKELK